jgi:hypothetical protein
MGRKERRKEGKGGYEEKECRGIDGTRKEAVVKTR